MASRDLDMSELPRGVGFRCQIIIKIGWDESTSDDRFSLPSPRRHVNQGADFRRHCVAQIPDLAEHKRPAVVGYLQRSCTIAPATSTVTAITNGADWSGPLTSSIWSIGSFFLGATEK